MRQPQTTLPTFNTGEVVKINPATPIKAGHSRVGILKPQNRYSAQTIRTGTTGLSTALDQQRTPMTGKSFKGRNSKLQLQTPTLEAMSNNFFTDNITPTGNFLDYPYAYDQDKEEECEFQEKLYRASKAQSEKLLEWRRENLFPSAREEFPGARDFA